MIGKLTGKFGGAMDGGCVLIDVMGVGYSVRVPLNTSIHIGVQGASVSLFIHTAVREDAIDLYGFLSEEELAFFKQLMSVSGIGPKTAIGILNVSDVATLKRAIAHGDAAALTKVFGIGKKSAERIVVELKDKMIFIGSADSPTAIGGDAEVVEALMALGYSAHEAREVLKKIDSKGAIRDKIAAALKYLGQGAAAL